MRWLTNITDRWAAFLRFLVRAILMTNGFMAATFSVWFIARFLWRLRAYLEKVWFSHDW